MSYFKKRLNETLGSIPETPAAPAAPPKRAPTRPAPGRPAPGRPAPTPKPGPGQDPLWRPFKKPGPDVRPKNVEGEEDITEDYEGESHPSTVGFWRDLPRNRSHTLGKHPIMALYGDQLSRESWGHTKEKLDASRADVQQAMQLLQQIMQIERGHEEELVDLAKRITVQVWGIPEQMLNGQLTQDVEQNIESDEDFGEQTAEEIHPDLLKQVNKRITMNTMTQGSAVHAMLSIHHAVDREIEAIDPRLLELYNKLSAASHHYYWLIDIPAMFAMLGMSAVGSAKVNYDEGEEGGEMGMEGDPEGMEGDPEQGDEGPMPTIDARGIVFPVLAQEMNKGVAELLSHHGLNDTGGVDPRQILDKADDIRLEPYLIQIGPALWRRFLAVRPREIGLAEIVRALAVQQPDELQRIITAVVEDPDHAKQLLNDLVSEPEEFDISDYDDDDYDIYGDDPDFHGDDPEFAEDIISDIGRYLSEDVNAPFPFVLTEDLRDHLMKHFSAHVPADQIELALANPRLAMKLVYGVYKGIIDSVDEPGAEEKVANLKPSAPEKEAKQAAKSEGDIEHDRQVAAAREISPKYWPWIIKVRKENPDVEIDPGWFDYFEGTQQSNDDIVDKTPEEVADESHRWHDEQFSMQKKGGTYKLTPQSEGSIQFGGYWFVPVDLADSPIEGSKMQNCIGSYCKPNNDTKVFSMRNKFNNPHVSISVKKGYSSSHWQISEIKGKQNKRPVDKYIPGVMEFVDYVTSDNQPLGVPVYVGDGGDFWHMSDPADFWKWLNRSVDPVPLLQRKREFVTALTPEQSLQLLDRYGGKISENRELTDKMIDNLQPDQVQKVLLEKGPQLHQNFFISALKNKKLSREFATQAVKQTELRRSVEMIIQAVYEPEQFLSTIQNIPLDDLLLAYENYQDAIDSYTGHHKVFGDLFFNTLRLQDPGGYSSRVSDKKLFQFMERTPTEVLLNIAQQPIDSREGVQAWISFRQGHENFRKVMVQELLSREISLEQRASLINQYRSVLPDQDVLNWLASLNKDELIELTQLDIPGLEMHVRKLLLLLGHLKHDAVKVNVEDWFDRVQHTDDIEDLRALYNTMPRKGGESLRLRKYTLRRIARLERIANAAEEAQA